MGARTEKQPRLFEDDIPKNPKARKALWLDPADCPHLVWEDTVTI